MLTNDTKNYFLNPWLINESGLDYLLKVIFQNMVDFEGCKI